LQGGDAAIVASLERGNLPDAPVSPRERALLEFVELLTKHAYRATDADTERLRAAGWTDPQIAEAVYITALFAFFNRVADAFGLDDPGYRELAAAGKWEGLPTKNMSATEPAGDSEDRKS
jgi:alkylhydroperoxidase family enzyme